ncbi:MAG: hypothetical protein WCQ95_08925 [Bacteroidota bacterium]
MRKVIFMLTLLLATSGLFAQQFNMIEKTYEITGKAKRGTLVNVKYDKDLGQYKLYYTIQSGLTNITLQIYTFDKDFTFIEVKNEDVPMDKLSEMKRTNPLDFSWVNYKGGAYTVEGNNVEANLLGTLVIKKKRISYSYNWFNMNYTKTVQILDKVKPKNDEGTRFYYFTHFEDDANGDLYILCGARDAKKGKDPLKYYKEFHILKYNKNLDLIKDLEIPFDFYNNYIYAKSLTEGSGEDADNAAISELIFVFAPADYGKTNRDPDNTNYTYLRLDKDLNLTERIPFKSKAGYWNIDYILATDNAVYAFGPLASGKDDYYNNLVGKVSKYKSVQLMKVADKKIEYLTETTLDEFAAKLKTPPSQKRSPDYDGKKFDIINYKVFDNGDFMVVGQNFKLAQTVSTTPGNFTVGQEREKQYNDIIAFHFDGKGVLKAQYGVDTKESNEYSKKNGTPQSMLMGKNPNNMYWVVQEIRGYSDWFRKILTYPRVAKVDMSAATLGDFTALGDKEYYLDPKFPYLESEPGKLVFFGSNKPGKIIWFAKIDLE